MTTEREFAVTFIRHAMPVVDSTADPAEWELSTDGELAAAAMGLLVDDTVAVCSSPERKAVRTVSRATRIPVSQIRTDPRFREVDRMEQVHSGFRDVRQAWIEGVIDERHAGWETPHEVAQRMTRGLRDGASDRLIIGTHGMALTAWFISVGLVPPGTAASSFWENLQFPDQLSVRFNGDTASWL